MTQLQSFGAALVATLGIWFALLIGAIITVRTLSAQGAIDLLGGILVFAALISLALVVDGYLWLRWFQRRRQRA